jgi:peptide/nickel transport system ATP-binding protein
VSALPAGTATARDEAASPLIECRNVSKDFRTGGAFGGGTEVRAVENVSLEVRRGEALAIVGESGSGKTTLARMLLGLLEPSSGAIHFDGTPLRETDRRALARRVQPVFQDPYSSLNPRKSVAQIVSLPLAVHGAGTRAERVDRVEELLGLVGLPRRVAHAYPSQLSGGQRQRVAIARALAIRPEVLICDEPTSALDVSVQAQILNLLQDLRDELTLTYVFVSHNLAVVRHIAQRVAVMYFGRIVELGPAEDLFERPRHPYTQALLGSILTVNPALGLPEPGMRRGARDPHHRPSGCSFHPRCPQALPDCARVAPVAHGGAAGFVECHLFAAPEKPGILTERQRGAD